MVVKQSAELISSGRVGPITITGHLREAMNRRTRCDKGEDVNHGVTLGDVLKVASRRTFRTKPAPQ